VRGLAYSSFPINILMRNEDNFSIGTIAPEIWAGTQVAKGGRL